jgi:ParB family chromosome partitioning protein
MPGWSTIAAGVAGAGDDVDDARRQVGLLADLGEEQRGQRRGLGRLEHDGVAAGQRRGDLPGEHEQREVPRDDLADDAERARVSGP